MAKPIISLKGVSKSYQGQTILQPLNLDIYNREFLTLLGPSGCGKTTLLRLLSGFEMPDSGTIVLNNEDITTLPAEKRHINMVFQSYALFPHMNVYDNVAFGLRCQKVKKEEIKSRVMAALSRVQLEKYLDRYPNQLSGGQQQRVAIARAIVNEPLVLLLDEPLSALDYHLRRSMRIELKALQRKLGITFLFVTHDQEEALSLSDRIVVMDHGLIEQIGTPRDIYEEPQNIHVATFVGQANIFHTQVKSANQTTLEAEIANTLFSFKNSRQFSTGDHINIIIRPEDIEVWGTNEIEKTTETLEATVVEVIYKGSTVDLIVKLNDEQLVAATQFFDEDDEKLEFSLGEPVLIRWNSGWEVLLPNETR